MIQNIIPYFASLFDWEDWIFRKIMCLKEVNGNHIDVSKPPQPYKILMSVHNIEKSLPSILERHSKNKENLIFIDDASTDNTVKKARELGVEVIPCLINKHKPQEIRHGLTHLDSSIETVIVMDPDTIFLERYKGKGQTLEEAVSWFQQTKANATAVNMRVKNENLLTKLQDVEYNISMQVGRKSLRDDTIVSGGCGFFERKTLELIMREHSGSVLAEDYETSLRILRKNGRIIYNPNFVVETEGPRTLKQFTKQRIWWDESIVKVLFESLSMKRNPTISNKKRNNMRELYNHYIYHWGMDVLAHPLKLAGLPFVAMSFGNIAEKIIGIDYLPSMVNTPVGHINVGPEVACIFYGSYVLLSSANLILNGLPHKEKYIPAVLTYPFYKMYQLTVPRILGFIKGSGHILEKLKKKKQDFTLPKNYYENYETDHFKPQILSDSGVKRFFSGDKEQYQILFYKTPYHDVSVLEFKIMPEILKGYISCNGTNLFLGIDMEDRFIRIASLEEAKKYFPKPMHQRIQAEPFKVQSGFVAKEPKGEGFILMYQDSFKDGRKTPIYLLKKDNRESIKYNYVVGAPNSSEKNFSGLENLVLIITHNSTNEKVNLKLDKPDGRGAYGSIN